MLHQAVLLAALVPRVSALVPPRDADRHAMSLRAARVRGARLAPARKASPDDSAPPAAAAAATARWLGGLALSGAALGPVCDNLHSGFGVLSYARYEVAAGAAPEWWGGGALFQTATWVPPMFALAALIIGAIDVAVDGAAPRPSGRRVAAGVAAFVAVYAASAFGGGAPPLGLGLDARAVSAALWPLALGLAAWEGSAGGAVAGAATALGGPAIEIALLGGGGAFPEPFGPLYAYARPDVWGVPAWIPAVYFAGGPAVALVSRFLRRR